MADVWFANGQTSIILREWINDASLLNGAGKTGLTFSSAGLIISTMADNEATATTYTQAGSTIETVTTLGTFATPTATKCRFREVDSVNLPGLYELQIADARWGVNGARYVDVSLPPVSGLGTVPVRRRVQLTAVNPQVATNFGLSALPTANAGASGGVPVFDANLSVAANLKYILGTLLTETAGQIAAAFKKLFDVSSPTLTAQDVNQTGDSYARIGANGAGLTALGDTRIAHLNADVDSRLAPTVAGRTLDVSAGGEAGLDWANVGSPTATNDLTNTKINTTDNAVPATLAASQPNYAPAKAGDQMDLVNAPNATAVTAIQLGLSKPGTAQTIDQTTALPGSPSVGTIGEALKRADAQTGDSFARLGAPAGASVSADIAEIEGETDGIASIPTNPLLTTDVRLPAGGTPISTLTQANILSDATPFPGADIALIKTDTGNLINRLGAFVGSGVNTVLGFLQAIMRSDVSAPSGVGGTFDPATDSEQAIAAAIGVLPVPATVAAIVDGVWNELLAGHTTPGSAAQLLIDASAASGAPTVNQIVNGILNELLAGHTTPGSVAVAIELINAVYAIVQTIGAGVTFVRSPVSANGDTEVRLGVRYSGVYALHYTSNSSADLLASGITVALNFANQKFLASSVTGAPGAWHIYVGISETQTAVLVLGTYDAQLALYANGVEVPELSNFKMTVAPNP